MSAPSPVESGGGLANERRSPAQVEERLDALIAEIRREYHAPAAAGAKPGPCDVLIVAHGHISRAFAARWVGHSIAGNPSLILETGGVGILRFVRGSELVVWS